MLIPSTSEASNTFCCSFNTSRVSLDNYTEAVFIPAISFASIYNTVVLLELTNNFLQPLCLYITTNFNGNFEYAVEFVDVTKLSTEVSRLVYE